MKSKTEHDIFFGIYKIYLEKIIDKYGIEYSTQYHFEAIDYTKKAYEEYLGSVIRYKVKDLM